MTSIAPQDRYRRLDLIGRGGMGEVFLADDLLLRRKVAIKVVHKTALSNPRAEKLLRREAKAAAALDNPLICKVYEVGEVDGRVFIAMEYIQGETLRQRMQRGPIPVRDIINVAREIADALEEAGRKGVIHRDLKPSNIIMTPQGRVKIMDFGLAKRLPGEEVSDMSSATPEGMVVGTREYMSPEQLRGKPLDPSSDLFALGLILYEMLSGVHPFKKAQAIDTQFAILNEAPEELLDLPNDAPDELCVLVENLLSKSPTERPRIGDLRERLSRITETSPRDGKAPDRTMATSASMEAFVARKPRVVLAMGTALLAAFIGLLLWVYLRPEATPPQAKMSTLVTWPSNEEHASLSPDGKSVTFISDRNGIKDIWLLDLAGGEPRKITNGAGDLTAQTFSEDGTEVAYTLESPAQKLLQTIRLDGGPPTRSISLPNTTRVFRLICWTGDDVFLETQDRLLIKLSLITGQPTTISTPPKAQRAPYSFDVSKDGRRVAFSGQNDDGSRSVWTQDVNGTAHPVTAPGASDQSPFFSDRAGNMGLFLESNRSGQEDIWFLDRPGREPRQITFGSNREFIEAVSLDGRVIVFSEDQQGGSIFSYDMATGKRRQLTAENTRDISPTLARGGRFAFARTRLAATQPMKLSSIVIDSLSDGGASGGKVAVRDGFAPALSPDGRYLAFMTQPTAAGVPHLNLLDMESGHVRDLGARLLRTLGFMAFAWSFTARDIAWSPQGDLLYTDTQDGASSRLMRLKPNAEPVVLSTFGKGELATNFVFSADGSRFLFLHTRQGADNTVDEIKGQGLTTLFSANVEATVLLGLHNGSPLVVQRAQSSDPFALRTWTGGAWRDLAQITAVAGSWRYIPSAHSVAFSRRDAVDVENIFLKDLQTGKETRVTSNGIQGIAFSPVVEAGNGLLVFSQQLRNKDVGIIRLDSH